MQVEARASSPFWHVLHHKLFAPMDMRCTSFGGPHLPDPGPDAITEHRERQV
eukprot:SAG25_NODE_10699_length_325_cov_0.676991_2_plen_51_part_01